MKNLSHIEDVKRLKAQQNQLLAAQKNTVTQQNTIVRAWGAMEQPTDLRSFCCS